MPATFGAIGATLTGGTGSTANLAVPTGMANNQVALASIYLEANRTITPPDGTWTLLGGAPLATSITWHYLWWKRATAADSGTYNFTFTSTYRLGQVMRVAGCKTTGSPISAWDGQVLASNGTAAPVTSLTVPDDDSMLAWFATNFSTGTWTQPSTFTERGSDGTEIIGASKDGVAAGATGNINGSSTGNNQRTAFLLALAPEPATITLPPRRRTRGPNYRR